MTKKQKKVLARIIISVVLLVAAVLIPCGGFVRAALFLIPYFVIGYDVLRRAVKNIANGRIFDENFLMALATVGAFAIGEYPEAVAVMLFYQVGELFQGYAVGKSRKSISDLMDIRPDYANVEGEDGSTHKIDPDEVAVGDIIVVRPGEKIPLDGEIIEGESGLDTSALTGESVRRSVRAGDDVISGCINLSGVLRVRVTKEFGESTVSKILELVENASSNKAVTENFITKFARYYTPAVVGCAVLLAVLPPLILHGGWSDWLNRALIFLVVSCPCALVISVPLSFFGGIGGASRVGILIKGSNYLEALSKCGAVVLDKTGTLTEGSFKVTEVHAVGCDEQRLLRWAAAAERYSNHPIAVSVRDAVGDDGCNVEDAHETAGHGVFARVDGDEVYAGNGKLMSDIGVSCDDAGAVGTAVHVAVNGQYCGYILISDSIKPASAEAITKLKTLGVKKTVLLTGDESAVADDVAARLKIDEVHAELLPADKVAHLERLLGEKRGKETVAFVGDGINDAPVLTEADVGIAMGAIGSDAAIEAADIVLMNDDPRDIAAAISISRRTMGIVWQNIIFALAVKLSVLALSAFGLANMWAAVAADVGVTVLAVLNAMRAMKASK